MRQMQAISEQSEKPMPYDNGLIPMPTSLIGNFFNGQCPDPCDMIKGPCACGAWHHLSDWSQELVQGLES